MDISTKYLGLNVPSPVIVGSCELSSNIDNLKRMEDAGAGAIILRSLFEEEIVCKINSNSYTHAYTTAYGKTYEYARSHGGNENVNRYFELIHKAKQSIGIPIIGSINCFQFESWAGHLKNFEEAGCDAIEISVCTIPSDMSIGTDDIERIFNSIISTTRRITSMPVAMKVSRYFTDMAKFMQQLSWNNIQGLTLFNQPLQYDIDLDSMLPCAVKQHSHAEEFYNSLAWITLLSGKMRCDISASAGINDSHDAIKAMLAGAGTVQAITCLRDRGIEYIAEINQGIKEWMEHAGYNSLADFKGKMTLPSSAQSADEMRFLAMQFSGFFDQNTSN